MKRNIIFGITLIVILLLIGCILLKDKEIQKLEKDLSNISSKEEEKYDETNEKDVQEEDKRLSITEGEMTTIINEIIPVTNKISLYETEVTIKNGNVLINDTTRSIETEKVTKVTGFYEQSSDSMCIYALTESKNIYVLSYVNYLGIKDQQFKKIDIENVDSIIVLDVEKYSDKIGQTPMRNQIYAKVDENLFNIRQDCF